MKVLIIDDEDDIRLIVCLSLTRIGGMQVVEARNGDEGLTLARQEHPDAILLDVMMPVMDGPATLAALRADPATATVPVVFLTAKALPRELTYLKDLGSLGVLTKPFDPSLLPRDLLALLRPQP